MLAFEVEDLAEMAWNLSIGYLRSEVREWVRRSAANCGLA